MPVSSGLQKYFDSQQKKKSQGDMKKKLQALSENVDPAFMKSFEAFHDRILDIVEETPESENMLHQEIDDLDLNVRNSRRVHDMKKAAAVIKATEKI